MFTKFSADLAYLRSDLRLRTGSRFHIGADELCALRCIVSSSEKPDETAKAQGYGSREVGVVISAGL